MFAELDVGAVIGVGGVVTGILVALGKFYMDSRSQAAALKTKDRADAIQEWKEYADNQQRQYLALVDNLQKQNNFQAGQIDDLKREHTAQLTQMRTSCDDCLKREAAVRVVLVETKAEMRIMEMDIRRLKVIAGAGEPPIVSSALVIADITGLIREASPAVGPILHWMRHDLIGKTIEVLVPIRLRARHGEAFKKFQESGGKLSQDMKVVTLKTYALTGDGDEIPVMVAINPWMQGDQVMVSAEISLRPAPKLATQEQLEEITAPELK